MANFGPSESDIAEHNAEKAKWLSAKMGLTHFCSECGEEIYLNTKQGSWYHKQKFGDGYLFCQVPQDIVDFKAEPMREDELQDWHDRIMKDDWYYTGKEPY
jgi:hypothetical protein